MSINAQYINLLICLNFYADKLLTGVEIKT